MSLPRPYGRVAAAHCCAAAPKNRTCASQRIRLKPLKGIFQHPVTQLFLFSVTRLTANALPLNEWVSSHCKAFTLLWQPSCVAFTIRACSRLTCR